MIGDEIHFTSQLRYAIDACVIIQNENRGVDIEYTLPPFPMPSEKRNKGQSHLMARNITLKQDDIIVHPTTSDKNAIDSNLVKDLSVLKYVNSLPNVSL